MSEEMVDLEVNLGPELTTKIRKMTKQELINCIVVDVLRSRVQDEVVQGLEDKLSREQRSHNDTQLKLDIAESYVAQAKAMIQGAMDRWDEYDV